jgi:peptidoglycan hydrolase-like protein with peptidoglycan-binding domain
VRPRRLAAIVVIIALGSGALGWLGASRIKSPAQLAAQIASPAASLITVPVQSMTLSADVITRGTVRHRAPTRVNLASSSLKPSASGLVTLAPEKGATLDEGKVAMAVGERPVFVLQGSVPAFRDLTLGTEGDDVRQLEDGLKRLGFDPGPTDGLFDAETATAVTAWYEKSGWTAFGATEQQRQALATARDTATKAQQAHYQAALLVAQTRSQLEAERSTAEGTLAAAQTKAPNAEDAAAIARRTIESTTSTVERDMAAANAELVTKTATLHAAEAAKVEAQAMVKSAPAGATPAEHAALQAALAKATEAAAVASAEVGAAQSNLSAVKANSSAATKRAADEAAMAERDAVAATDDLARAQASSQRASNRAAAGSPELSLLAQAANSAAADAAVAMADYQSLVAHTGTQIPADELLFLGDLPRRVDDVKVKRGDPATAELMTVSGLELSIDASLSSNDAKLVANGAKVNIEEPDLGITATGTVTVRSEQPGTNGVDPQKFYLEVTPVNAPSSLVGASVKLTIPVKSTTGEVLVLPLSALAIGASGTSRVEIVSGAATRFVNVVPGLVAQGLVEVTAPAGDLAKGDNAVVGHGNEQPVTPAGDPSKNPPAPATSAVDASTGTPSSTSSPPTSGIALRA